MTLIDAQMRDFQEQVLTQLRVMASAGEAYLAQLAWFIEHDIRFQQHHTGLMRCVGHELTPSAEGASGAAVWLHMTIQGLLRSATRQREIAADTDERFLVAALLVLLRPDVVAILRESQGQSPTAISAGLQRLVYGFLTN